MSKRGKQKITLILFLLILSILVILFIGESLSKPQMRSIGGPPPNLEVEKVTIEKGDDNYVAGWFMPGEINKPGILLLHSVRSNRTEMLSRSRFLNKAGYSVLLIDMQAHGETPGDRITFGFRESFDVKSAVEYLRGRVEPNKVGVIGVSLGGAAILLGKPTLNADAVILESVYSSIERAVENRIAIRVGAIGEYLAPLLTWQINARLGISTEELSPLKKISQLKAPVMIIAGSDDLHTRVDESQLLFNKANDPKYLWIIDGAKHQNFHTYAGNDYENRVLVFFQKYLE